MFKIKRYSFGHHFFIAMFLGAALFGVVGCEKISTSEQDVAQPQDTGGLSSAEAEKSVATEDKDEDTGNDLFGRAYGVASAVVYDKAVESTQPSSDGRMVDIKDFGFAGAYLAARYAAINNIPDALAVYGQRALESTGIDIAKRRLIAQTFPAALFSGNYENALAMATDIAKMEDIDSPVAQLLLIAQAFRDENYDHAAKVVAGLPDQRLTQAIKPVLSAWLVAVKQDAKIAADQLSSVSAPYGIAPIWQAQTAFFLKMAGQDKTAALEMSQSFSSAPSFKSALLTVDLLSGAEQKNLAKDVIAEVNPDLKALGIDQKLSAALDRGQALYDKPETPAEGMANLLADLASVLGKNRGQNRFALGLLRIALYLSPEDPFFKMQLAEAKLAEGASDAAIQLYRDISATMLLKDVALLQGARTAVLSEKKDVAKDFIDQLNQNPQPTPFLRAELATLYRGIDECQQALPHYDVLLNTNISGTLSKERKAELHFSRGTCHDEAGDWDAAEADLLQALKLMPDQPYVLNYLGYTWADRGENIDQALDYIQRAVSLRPNDGFIVDSLGWVYYKIGQMDKALLNLEHAVQLVPNDPTINDHLGDVYWQLGRKSEARFQWQRVTSLTESQQREHVEARARAAAKLSGDLDQVVPFTPRKDEVAPADGDANSTEAGPSNAED